MVAVEADPAAVHRTEARSPVPARLAEDEATVPGERQRVAGRPPVPLPTRSRVAACSASADHGHGWQRLALGQGVHEVADELGRQPRGGVGEDDAAVAGVGVDPQAGEEARHGPAVAGVADALDVPHLPAQAMGSCPGRARNVVDSDGQAHLTQRLSRQSPAVSPVRNAAQRARSSTVDQSCWPAAMARRRARARRAGHRPGDGPPARRRARNGSSCGSSRGRSRPSVTAVPRHPGGVHQLAEHGIPDVGVVEPRTGTELQLRLRGDEVGPGPPATRSHQGPAVSACRPEVWRAAATVTGRTAGRRGGPRWRQRGRAGPRRAAAAPRPPRRSW